MSKKIFLTVLFLMLSFCSYAEDRIKNANGSFKVFALPGFNFMESYFAEVKEGYIIAGTAYDDTGPYQRAVAAKIDKAGHLLWKKEIGHGRSSAVHKVIAMENGIVFAGSIDARDGGPSEESTGMVFKLDTDGAFVWDSRIRFGRVTHAMDVARAGKDVVAVGRIRQGEYEDSGFIAGFDSEGKLSWVSKKKYWLDFVYALDKGDFLAGGGGWLARFDNKGNTLWERFFSDNGVAGTVAELPDGDIILIGQSGRYPFVSRMNSNGVQVWNKKVEIGGSCGILSLRRFGDEIKAIGFTCETEPERVWGAAISASGNIKALKKHLKSCADNSGVGQAFISGENTFLTFGAVMGQEDGDAKIWVFESSFYFESEKDK